MYNFHVSNATSVYPFYIFSRFIFIFFTWQNKNKSFGDKREIANRSVGLLADLIATR